MKKNRQITAKICKRKLVRRKYCRYASVKSLTGHKAGNVMDDQSAPEPQNITSLHFYTQPNKNYTKTSQVIISFRCSFVFKYFHQVLIFSSGPRDNPN